TVEIEMLVSTSAQRRYNSSTSGWSSESASTRAITRRCSVIRMPLAAQRASILVFEAVTNTNPSRGNHIAFSSEVDTGSRQENASKQEAGVRLCFHRNRAPGLVGGGVHRGGRRRSHIGFRPRRGGAPARPRGGRLRAGNSPAGDRFHEI